MQVELNFSNKVVEDSVHTIVPYNKRGSFIKEDIKETYDLVFSLKSAQEFTPAYFNANACKFLSLMSDSSLLFLDSETFMREKHLFPTWPNYNIARDPIILYGMPAVQYENEYHCLPRQAHYPINLINKGKRQINPAIVNIHQIDKLYEEEMYFYLFSYSIKEDDKPVTLLDFTPKKGMSAKVAGYLNIKGTYLTRNIEEMNDCIRNLASQGAKYTIYGE